ncbi:phage tail tip fiber protein [Pseudomonas anguilliseptica]|uniref:phage tail tip fiber protein n=1 Tax=Pseudomonas anguilliseptica TaxID=53406 RepID=UPI00325BF457
MKTRRITLPPVPPAVAAELRPLFAAMAEIIETGEGVRGDKLDRKMTMRDLLDGGIARLRIPGNPEGGITPNLPTPNMSVPPAPTGFAADGSFFGMIHLTWEPPQAQYNNHAHANIYRSTKDNFANAELIGREAGMFYSDLVRNDAVSVGDPLNLPGYFYWVTFTSTAAVEGPPNSPNGTFAKPLSDVRYLLSTLSRGLEDEPTDIGSPEETLILNAKRFAVRVGPQGEAVYPLIIADVGGVPTVALDTALIRSASIQEGQLGPITFGKLFDAAGNPVTTLAGKLRADMLDVDSLRVGDANISGVIKSSAVGANGQPRWVLDKNGGLTLSSSSASGRMEVRDNVIKVFDGVGRLRVQLGDLTV